MRLLVALLIVLVFATGVFGQSVTNNLGYIGAYRAWEVIVIPLGKPLDSTKFSPWTPTAADSGFYVQCRRGSTTTYQKTAGPTEVRPWSTTFTGTTAPAIDIVTRDSAWWSGAHAKNVDSNFYFRDTIRRLNNGTTSGCLACQLMYTRRNGTTTQRMYTTFNLQVLQSPLDSMNIGLIAGSAPASDSLKSILTGTKRTLSITRFIADSMEMARFRRTTDSATRVNWYNGSDTTWSVTSNGSGKPAVAFRNINGVGVAGSNGFYVSSAAREATLFAATHASSTSGIGFKAVSSSSAGAGITAECLGGSGLVTNSAAYSGEGVITSQIANGAITSASTSTGWITAPGFATHALKIIRDTLFGGRYGRATSNATDSSFVSSDLTALTDFYNYAPIYCFYGTGKGQSAVITKVVKTAANVDSITFSPKFVTAPAVGDSFVIYSALRGIYGIAGKALRDSSVSRTRNGIDSIIAGTGKVTLAAGTHTGAVIPTVTTVTNDVGITQTGADKAWATATRTLTAGTNIVLAKGVGVTGFNDIAATDVWGAATRTLSAGTNIVLAKGVGVTGFNDIAATDVWSVAARTLTDTTNISKLRNGLSTYAGGPISGITGVTFPAIVANEASVTKLRDSTSTFGTPIAAIKAKTDNLPANPAAVGSNMGTITGGTVDTVVKAVYVGKMIDSVQENIGTHVWASVIRTLTAVPTGGALELSVTKLRDSLTILASTARLQKIDSISNLFALCSAIKAATDTSLAAAGYKSTSSSTQGFSTNTDTLHIWWGPTELLKTLFWHVGKGPGSIEIDSTRVIWLP